MTLVGVASYGLVEATARLPTEPLDDDRWADLQRAAARHRVTGLLHRAIADGALAATDEQAASAAAALRAEVCRTLTLESLLVDTVDLLAGVDIECRILKGASLAYLDYPDPSLRGYIDIDLLVSPADFDRATATLTAAGHVRHVPQQAPGFDRRFGKGATLVSPSGLEVDLHRTFDRGPFGLSIQLADLWSSSEPFLLGGRTMAALGAEERFLSICFHAALGNIPPRLVPLRDVAQMLANSAIDATRVRALSTRWRSDAVVGRAVCLAMSTFGLPPVNPIARWATAHRLTPKESNLLALYVERDRSHAARVWAITRSLPGIGTRAAYLRGVFLPDRRYLDATAPSPLARLRSVRQPWRFLEEDVDEGSKW